METTAISAEPGETPAGRAAGGGDTLVCIAGERSWTVRLPEEGELLIGRDPQARLTLDDPLVSRIHAQILLVPEGLRLSDLGSRHGTTVNGERLGAPRLLRSGDVIGIGESTIVVRRAARAARAQQVGELGALLRRLGEELDRGQRYQREATLLILRMRGRMDAPALLAALLPRLRAIDVAAPLGEGEVAVLLPELGGDDALALLEAGGELPGQLAIGVAVAPFDGVDGETLLGAARAAAELATAGQRRLAREALVEVAAGAHRGQLADPAMVRLYELARRLARSTLPVLVLGETGAGKELAAAAVHAFSPRAAGPFVSVNCAAIPETLAESELFGHARGAFSGALAAKVGQLEAAHGGTLFLDEIGELPLSIQAKLLRALESGELQRVGEVSPRSVDLRIVAATNRDLEREVEQGRFRRDLYFRLGAARLELPALRERPRDLACLAARFLEDQCREQGRPALSWSVAAAHALYGYDWPGNLRELRNAVQYAVSAAPDDAVEVEVWHLPPAITRARRRDEAGERGDGAAAEGSGVERGGAASEGGEPGPGATGSGELRAAGGGASGGGSGGSGASFRPIADEVRELERRRMVEALRITGGVQNRAAELIEMPLRTFATKLKRYRIQAADWAG